MKKNGKLLFLAALLSIACATAYAAEIHPVSGISESDEAPMDPPPQERRLYEYKTEPGQLKRDKLGMIDPTPDVVSLEYLPKDGKGFVDWEAAIREGIINPRGSIFTLPGPEPIEGWSEAAGDVVIRSKMDFMPDVLFPHSAHKDWLKCSNCHPRIFEKKAGATPISMTSIWKGKFCGVCHGKVAFPLDNCYKCHSMPKYGVVNADTGADGAGSGEALPENTPETTEP